MCFFSSEGVEEGLDTAMQQHENGAKENGGGETSNGNGTPKSKNKKKKNNKARGFGDMGGMGYHPMGPPMPFAMMAPMGMPMMGGPAGFGIGMGAMGMGGPPMMMGGPMMRPPRPQRGPHFPQNQMRLTIEVNVQFEVFTSHLVPEPVTKEMIKK